MCAEQGHACARARARALRLPAPSALLSPIPPNNVTEVTVEYMTIVVESIVVRSEALRGRACVGERCTSSPFWQVDGEARGGEPGCSVGEARALHAAAAGEQNGAASQRRARAAARLW